MHDNNRVIVEHRIRQAIDPKNTCEVIQSITNPASAMLEGFLSKPIFIKERLAPDAVLQGTKDMSFRWIRSFVTRPSRH